MEQLLVDLNKLLERMEGDRDLIKEVFSIFVEEAPVRRVKFEKALITENRDALVMLAHALKGASGTLLAEPLRQACYDLEHAARDNDADKVRVLVPQVLGLLDNTSEYMVKLLPSV
ncbi:MAG: Hpt domain-containing protein [Desulfovibrio sp.]|nr:Hpt domain-containing protein [Desulfovibrio sp.]MBI4960129.1 Hpt domain-containing protein [Desulfovibrio sp.]